MSDGTAELHEFQRGLDNLLDRAQTSVDAAVDDKYLRVEDSRARLARYREGMKALKDDVTYTRTCEAHLGQFLLGYVPGQAAIESRYAAPNEIPPPQHQPSHDDFARVAEGLAYEAPPRFLRGV
jgi:hypothetical protein